MSDSKKKKRSGKFDASVGFVFRLIESVNLLFWAVLIFLKIAYEHERFLYLLVFAFHMAVAMSTFDFVLDRMLPENSRRGIWFYLYLIALGVVADVASFVELITHGVDSGFTTLEIFEMVLWSLTVLIDIGYIIWAISAYMRASARKK